MSELLDTLAPSDVVSPHDDEAVVRAQGRAPSTRAGRRGDAGSYSVEALLVVVLLVVMVLGTFQLGRVS